MISAFLDGTVVTLSKVCKALLDLPEQNKKNLEARPDRRSLRRQDDRTGSSLHLLRELGMEGEKGE